MQTSDYDQISVIQCRVGIDRIIYYCGMHSHMSNGRREYVRELGADACRRLHKTGTIMVTATIDKLSTNTSNWRSVTLAGRVSTDGTCRGAQYTDGYGTWNDVVVQATVKVVLRSFSMPVKRSTKELISPGRDTLRPTETV